MKNIVIIGGGTGTYTLLSGLRKFPVNNSVIVSTADDGGSTGILRESLGVVPPGDIRQCLVGLSYTEDYLKDLFSYRFEKGVLKGHAAGNIIISALEKITGGIKPAIALASRMLNVRGEIIPATLKPTNLSALLENGKKIVGEHNIDEPKKNFESGIMNLELKPKLPANPDAVKALKSANVIVFGPGDLFTSIIPNLLVKGIREAINNSKAKKVLVCNIMTKFGQTDGFAASDFVNELEKYLKDKIDAVVVNSEPPKNKIFAKYKKEKAEMVRLDEKNIKTAKIIKANLIHNFKFKRNHADSLKRSFLRHDPDKAAKIIWELIN
jgi:uncharacterized cofD-like protein